MVKIDISFTGSETPIKEPYYNKSELIIPYPCSLSCSCSPYLITLPRGRVSVTLFGASGGYAGNIKGGKGGMINSIFTVDKMSKYYLYVGGKGANKGVTQTCGKAGYNGGGESASNRGGGGGSTDLRTIKDDINSQVLVSGGGGSGYRQDSQYNNQGGDGGGLCGEIGSHDNAGSKPCIATQEGCVNGKGTNNIGFRGNGSSTTLGATYGGGGGGYYGGGSEEYCGSSGGSSYSKFSNAKTFPGVNIGDGYAVIHYVRGLCTIRCRYSNNLFHISLSLIINYL